MTNASTQNPPESVITRLCLVRHGETDWNAARRLQGTIDIPLNALGIRQAQAAAHRLADAGIAAIYSSSLKRASVTAQIIGNGLGLPVITDARLVERNFGELQGWTQDEASARLPEQQRRLRAREPDFTPDQGESLRDVASRVTSAMNEMVARHRGSRVLCVAHGGVLDIAYRVATDKPLAAPRDFVIGNATLNWLLHDGERWQLEAWDQRDHLDRAIDELPI